MRSTQVLLDGGIAEPLLIGWLAVMLDRTKRFGLTICVGDVLKLIDPEDDPRYRDYVATI